MINVKALRAEYLARAKAMRKEGWKITDSDTSECLTVENATSSDLYEFKYSERENLKNDLPDWLEMDLEDYILALAANW